MALYVLNACAMLAFLYAEPGGDVVRDILLDDVHTCVAHTGNMCEVYSNILRIDGRDAAERCCADLESAGLQVVEPPDSAVWKRAAQIKVSPGHLSVCDCFALALAEDIGGTLLTSDHHDLDRVVPYGIAPIQFIR
ncbi:MAG TPA: PIN domain-containing protein [Capsulimonadaceae bacterium]